jgi:hypothetical protein
MKRVNILNKGVIPWLNIQGPILDVTVSDNIFKLLKGDKRIILEEIK